MRRLLAAALLAFSALWAPPAGAFEPATTGIVLMHGKWGTSGDQTTRPLADALKAAGFLVDQPEMPWSGGRLYDKPWEAALTEIDAAVARLRARGATKIVVSGQSMGGAAAVGYAASGRPIDAAVLIAPAHAPDGQVLRAKLAPTVATARDMVSSGHGDDTLAIMDFNSGDRTRSLRVKATPYLSYFAPDGGIAMTVNGPHVGTAPVLWIAGSLDPSQPFFGRAVWPFIPMATPKQRVDVIADHLDTPRVGREAIIEWLKKQN
jgi:pimeloyl-ACP methyl ester carboxylesterase